MCLVLDVTLLFHEISSSHGGEYDVQSCLLGYTGHLGNELLYKPRSFVLGSLIPDDGGSTHLRNVGRQSFYTAVYPRRQL
jgi:hypothetical protein